MPLKCQPRRITNKCCARIIRGPSGRIIRCQGYVMRVIKLPGGTIIQCLYDVLRGNQLPIPPPPQNNAKKETNAI